MGRLAATRDLPQAKAAPDQLPAVVMPKLKRRKPWPRWMVRYGRPALLWVSSGAFVIGLTFAGMTLVRDVHPEDVLAELDDVALQVSATLGLMVRDVMVEGRERQDGGTVLTALAVQYGTPILSMDVAAARTRLEALPWVEQAIVERHLPDTIWVRLTERQPLAVWQLDGKLRLIDPKGHVILEDGAAWSHLPLVIGKGAAKRADEFLMLIGSEPALAKRVTAATLIGERRWNVRLDTGVDVRLPEDGAAEAWSRLAELDRDQRLLQRDVLAIDLRLPDRMILRVATPSAFSTSAQTKPCA